MKTLLTRMTAFFALIISLASQRAEALVVTIDDFHNPLLMPSISGMSPMGSSALGWTYAPSGIVGGYREWVVTKTSAGVGSNAGYGIQSEIADGFAIIAAGPQSSWSSKLLWDGSAGITGTGVNDFALGLDLSLATAFEFNASVDLDNSVFGKLILWTSPSQYTEYDLGPLLGGGTEIAYSIPFGGVSPMSILNVNLAEVNAIELQFSADLRGTDINFNVQNMRFSEPPPVPEVSTAVSAAAFALIGGIVLMRGRKSAIAAPSPEEESL